MNIYHISQAVGFCTTHMLPLYSNTANYSFAGVFATSRPKGHHAHRVMSWHREEQQQREDLRPRKNSCTKTKWIWNQILASQLSNLTFKLSEVGAMTSKSMTIFPIPLRAEYRSPFNTVSSKSLMTAFACCMEWSLNRSLCVIVQSPYDGHTIDTLPINWFTSARLIQNPGQVLEANTVQLCSRCKTRTKLFH